MHTRIKKSLVWVFCLLFLSSLLHAQAGQHEQTLKDRVVLIHGLMRSTWSMYFLKSYLERQGYEVQLYAYPSARYTIAQHGENLYHAVQGIMLEHPAQKIHFVTHSLGGIIAREALSKLDRRELKHIGDLVMLAPPNRGSILARYVSSIPFIPYLVKPLSELSSNPQAYVHQVPKPAVHMAIIAGRYDAKVPPAFARLEGEPEPMIINATHMFIMNNASARALIVQFLKEGRFEPQAQAG